MKRQANDQIAANLRKRPSQNSHQNNVYNQQYTSELENASNNYGYDQKYNLLKSQAQIYSASSPAAYAESLNPYNLIFNGAPYTHPSGGWTAPIHQAPPLPNGPPPVSPYYNSTQPPPLPTSRHPSEPTPPPLPSSSSPSNHASYNTSKPWNRKFGKNNFDYSQNQLYSPIPESPPVEVEKIIKVNKKCKRKPMSSRMNHKKEWNREDALKALELEQEFNKMQKLPMLILKFPDPDVNKEIVRGYSKSIENVHFQQPSTARYCFVQLHPDADIEQVKTEISNIPFGTGFIQVERKNTRDEDEVLPPEDLDPYTLYIGNLPTTISVAAVKVKFPTAHRIDIGYAQRMKNTRYAFVRYETVDDALLAYRQTFNLIIESRTIIVRFRRQKGTVNLPGEPRFMTNFPPRIPLAVKKSSDLMEAPSEIDFMDESFIDHDDDLINHSVDIEEIETEEIEEDTENIVNNKVNIENKEDKEKVVNNQENNENIGNNQENTNRANITDTKQNIIKPNDVETTGSTVLDSSLIKTEIKDEPKDDMETCEDVEEDDKEVDPISSEDGEDDEEESEDGEDSDKSNDETNKAGNTSKDQQKGFYWDRLRLDEIAMEADVKPDITKIRILNSDTINEIADKGINRILDSDLLKKIDTEKIVENEDEDEELAALYGSLNPDD